jgi:hypothetical protein
MLSKGKIAVNWEKHTEHINVLYGQSVAFQNTKADSTHTYHLLTPWSRVLLEKLIVLQLVKKFPAFYGTRRFITAFITAHHLSLS